MKIRHKQSGVELEGRFVVGGARAHDGFTREWFASVDGSTYDRCEWEAVPEWVNVTEECEVSDYRDATGTRMLSLYHPETGENAMHAANGYRLRKVQVSIDGLPKYAFIVERKA